MKQAQTHHLVDFASRYARQSIKTFTPASALWRASLFEDDIDTLETLAAEAEKKGLQFGSVFSTFEIVNYYAVGLVTCLEWHARSRLVHLMQYRPSSIQPKDIQGIADLAISQMAANGVAVSHLLGAATKVSSIKEYVTIFQRLFDDLNIAASAERTLRTPRVSDGYGQETSLYEALETMYEHRHWLAHEISFASIGPPATRHVWSLTDAKTHVAHVIAAIRAIEALVTKYAPADFPERLTEEGFEESRVEKLTDAISKLEKEITDYLSDDEDGLEKWNLALGKHKAALQAETEFIDTAETLRPVRYYDVSDFMKEELLQSRLAFLTALKAETGH